MLELNCEQAFDPAADQEFFAKLPRRPGVLLIEMMDSAARPYLARTADIGRLAERLLRLPDATTKGLNLRSVAACVQYRVAGSRFEQLYAHYQQARGRFPRQYQGLVRLRPPAMLKVNLRNVYPRCYVTRRVGSDDGFYFGPFASRKEAESFNGKLLDLFKTRRCKIKIRRDPSFPGCIYSEMNMCLAPCFAGCTKEEYENEVTRLAETLKTNGASLVQAVERERAIASETLDFERAAALHKRLDKIGAALRGRPEIARCVKTLNAVILQRGAEEKTIAAFPVLSGTLSDPIWLRFAELSGEPRSVEAILRAGLELPSGNTNSEQASAASREAVVAGVAAGLPQDTHDEQTRRLGIPAVRAELSEHLSLVARWFYSNPREGEIFFHEGEWPYRRILRACARLMAEPASASTNLPGSNQASNQAERVSREKINRLKRFARMQRPPRK
jgi:excinuclease ABC subunit C